MTTNATAHSWRTSLARSAVFRAAGLLIFGFIGWLWFFSADDSAWKAVSLVAVLVLAALGGSTWYLSRARAESRWRATLDRYAEQEQAKRDTRLENFAAELTSAVYPLVLRRGLRDSWIKEEECPNRTATRRKLHR